MPTWPRLDWIQPRHEGGADQQEDRQLVLPIARQLEEIAADDLPGKDAAGEAGGDRAERGRRRIERGRSSVCAVPRTPPTDNRRAGRVELGVRAHEAIRRR